MIKCLSNNINFFWLIDFLQCILKSHDRAVCLQTKNLVKRFCHDKFIVYFWKNVSNDIHMFVFIMHCQKSVKRTLIYHLGKHRVIYIENQLLLNIKLNRDDWWLLFYYPYQLMTKKDINHFKGQQKPVSWPLQLLKGWNF